MIPKVEFEGLSQYRLPLCFELAGQTVELVLDDGYDYILKFTERTVEWGEKGGKTRTDRYECIKGDDDTYYVNAEIEGAKPRTGITVILDCENSLTTVVVARQGVHPRLPYRVTTEIFTGAIARPGRELPYRRHGFSTDLVGEAVEWSYNPDSHIVHVYYSERYIRATGIPRKDDSPDGKERRDVMTRRMEERKKYYPQYEEEFFCMKIKDGMYLVSFNEVNQEYHPIPHNHGNNMLFLMNLKRMMDVGRSFGAGSTDALENYLCCAYGRVVDVDPKCFEEPSAYRVL